MVERDAVSQLFAQYAWAQDTANFAVLREVFTEDARFTVEVPGMDTIGPIDGRDTIVAFVGETITGQDDQRRHVITNVRFEEKGEDRAIVTAILTLIVVAGGTLRVQSTGVYRNAVTREGGAWRFRSLHLMLDLPF
jgi:uncharacterized protein (TIGR02246 family)